MYMEIKHEKKEKEGGKQNRMGQCENRKRLMDLGDNCNSV